MPTYPGQHTVFLRGFNALCIWFSTLYVFCDGAGFYKEGRASGMSNGRGGGSESSLSSSVASFESCSTDGGLLPFQGAGHGFQLFCQVHLLAVRIGVQGFENL